MTDNASIEAICPVCWEAYDNISLHREVLPCGHSICSICLPNLEARNCPQCRNPIDEADPNRLLTSDDQAALVRSSSDSAIDINEINESEDSDTFWRICRSLMIPFATTNSKGTIILATLMFFLVMLICCLMRVPAIVLKLAEKKSFFENLLPAELASSDYIATRCATMIGNLAIYRVSFSYFLFLLFHCVVLLIVPKSTGLFDQVRNGLWLLKWIILFAFLFGAFSVKSEPNEPVMLLGFLGGFALNVLQIWLVARIGFDLNNVLSRLFRNLLTAACYCAAWSYAILLMWFYADNAACTLNRWLIAVNVFLCLVLAVIKQCMQTERAGLLSVSLVTLYIMHLTWTALSNNPNMACNPLLIDCSHASASISLESSALYAQTGLSMIIMFACVIYAVSQRSMFEVNFFYEVLFAGATLFAMMTLSYWSKPSSALQYNNGDIEAVWVKMAAGWVGLFVSCCCFDLF
uniref:RING-type domain-containing protein n=1 Tax=Plectus sambesii TaxID=2011161 RepID=A0A914WNF1_9BILA